MKEILFAKYNKSRRPGFQTRIRIYEEDGRRFMEKSAARSEGAAHIIQMYEASPQIAKIHHKLTVLKPEKLKDALVFPYVNAKTLDDTLAAKIGTDDFIPSTKRMLDLLFDIPSDFINPFILTDEFEQIFDCYESSEPAVIMANVDMLFENVIVSGHKYILTDYEWFFRFPVPIAYIKYRCLKYFYENHADKFASCYQKNTFISMFGIDDENQNFYEKMEDYFQQYIQGEGLAYQYTRRYYKPEKDLLSLINDIDLKQVHIRNLEAIIQNQAEQLKAQKLEKDLLESPLTEQPVNQNKLKNSMKKLVKRLISDNSNFYCQVLKYKRGPLDFPVYSEPKISIIVSAYNQLNYTYACLDSIIKNAGDVEYEVILADDNSIDGTKALGKYSKNLKVSRTRQNCGYIKNCNLAAKMARGEYILFLNNDTQAAAGWLSSLIWLIESDSSIGMVGSKLIDPKGILQEAGGILWSDGTSCYYGRGDDPQKPEYNYVREVDFISSTSIMLSKKLWQEIGGFDESYAPGYCEDADLAFAVRDKGFKVMYQPGSVVYHFKDVSNGTDTSGLNNQTQADNNRKLFEKWKENFAGQYERNPANLFAARERLGDKKIIVVVDSKVPTFDQDAGSRTTWQYLKMFVKHGYAVKFIGDDFESQEPYTTALMQNGIEVLYGAQMEQTLTDWLVNNKKYLNIAYINRPNIALKYMDLFREKTNCKIIYYGHDLHFLRERREYELTGSDFHKQQSEFWQGVEFDLMRKADISYYPSFIECEKIKSINRLARVKDLTAYAFDNFPQDLNLDFQTRKGLLFVGGFAHTPNADGVLWFAKEIWPQICGLPDMEFHIAGSQATEEIKALHGNGIVVEGFVSDEKLEQLYRSCRMVVAPLRYGAGVKGKIIEALYYGVPVVTTTVGAEGIAMAEETMYIADDPGKWCEAIRHLYTDYQQLKKMSEASSRLIKENYHTDKVWAKVEQDFQ